MSDWPILISASCVEPKGRETGGASAPSLLQVRIEAKCVCDNETLKSHIKHALTLEYPDVAPSPKRDGEVIMCASGPSLKYHLEEIRAYKGKNPIVACNGAHDYLIENGIVPDYACALDPTDIERFKLKTLECNYFLASQCRPELFKFMEGQHIAIFHVAYKADETDIFNPHPVIGGGSTTGLKAISLFYMAGFRTFHLYGYDGSFEDGKRRVTGEPMPLKAFECQPGHNDRNGKLVISDKKFWTSPEMGIQATELSLMMDSILPDAKIIPHGEGLIQEVLRMRETLEYTPDIHRLRPETASGFSGPGPLDSDKKLETSFDLSPHIVAATD